MKILFICHRIPYPPNKGDKIRSFHEIKYLSMRNDVYLACLVDDPEDLSYTNQLEKVCSTVDVVSINPRKEKVKSLLRLPTGRSLSVSYFYNDKLQKLIDHRLSTVDFDIIFCFSSSMAEYVFQSRLLKGRLHNRQLENRNSRLVARDSKPGDPNPKSEIRNPKLVMDFVDVDSDKWRQYARYAHWPFSWIYGLESERLASYEQRVAQFFDCSIFISQNEAEIFNGSSQGPNNVVTVPNGVDFLFFKPSGSNAPSSESPTLLFTGAMDYYANVDGVVWFAQEILPDLLKRFPSLTFYIVGRNPTPAVKALTSQSVKVTGYVKDIRPFYERATVYVAPLRMARGIQNKILEAMAMGKPVVTTSKAFEGIEAVPEKDLLIADEKEEFIHKINLLLRNQNRLNSLGESARKTVEQNYSWEQSMSLIDKILIPGEAPLETYQQKAHA